MSQNQNYLRTLPHELNQILTKGLTQTVKAWSINNEWDWTNDHYRSLQLMIEISRLNENEHKLIYIHIRDEALREFKEMINGKEDGYIWCNGAQQLHFRRNSINVSCDTFNSRFITDSFDRAVLSRKILDDWKPTAHLWKVASIARLRTGELCIFQNSLANLDIQVNSPLTRPVREMPADRKVVLTQLSPNSLPMTLDNIQTNADQLEQNGHIVTLTWN